MKRELPSLIKQERAIAIANNLPDMDMVQAEKARRNLHYYTRCIWPILEPGRAFVDNWHIGAICEHLEAVKKRQIKRLLINMPPRFMKSLLIAVAFPTWVWIDNPEHRWIFSSYSGVLSTRDNLKGRRVIDSDWYQKRYGHIYQLTTDQNVKNKYENNRTGVRMSTSVGGVGTGEGGDTLVVDDPHNVLEAGKESDVSREEVWTWWTETMSSRYNDQKTGAAVGVMQRVHEQDWAGRILEQGGWEHLMIPMRWEEGRSKVTSLGFVDPRKTDGELAWPARFDEDAVARLEKELGSYAAAGQLQQNPTPREGGMFKKSAWGMYHCSPQQMAAQCEEIIISGDLTFKGAAGSDYVSLQVWGRKGANKYVLARVTERMTFGQTKKALTRLAAEWPQNIAVVIEDKANGPAVMDDMKDVIPGLVAVDPQGGKIARANSIEAQHEAGNIYGPDPSIPGCEWITELIDVCAKFPLVAHDDDVDAFTQAIIWFKTKEGLKRSPKPAVGGSRLTVTVR